MEGSKLAAAILGEVRRAVVGKDEVLAKVLLAILAGGHILLEDIPGVGKSTVTCPSSMASSRADWVRLVARLSSSAKKRLHSTAPGWYSIRPASLL